MARGARSAGNRRDCRRRVETRRVGAIQCPERSGVLATRVGARRKGAANVVSDCCQMHCFLSTASGSISQHCAANGEPGDFAGPSLMNEHIVVC